MIAALNGLSDTAFVILVFAALVTLILLVKAAATVTRGVGIEWYWLVLTAVLWIAFWLMTR